MSLLGDFGTMPLPELLQWLAINQKSGVLLLQRGDVAKEISLLDGKIVASASNDPRDQFSQFLLSRGNVGEDDLLHALTLQSASGIPLGRLLVQEGLLAEEDVQKLLKIKAEETIHDLFLWEEGIFKFYNEVPVHERHVRIEMDLTMLMMEGGRRADEWARMRKVFPSSETLVRVLAEKLTLEILREPLYNRMVQILETTRRISDVCLMFHASDYWVTRTLFNMYELGILEVLQSPGPSAPARPETDWQVRGLCNRGLEEYETEQFEEALATFQQVLEIAPGHGLAEDMLDKVRRAVQVRRGAGDFDTSRVPQLLMPLEDLGDLSLSPQENYLLSKINGHSSVQAILQLSPIQEALAITALRKLEETGLISYRTVGVETT